MIDIPTLADPTKSIVRILDADRKGVGLGFIVGPSHIITCAHVINRALGRSARSDAQPERRTRIDVDFPLLTADADAPTRRARVETWHPPSTDEFTSSDAAGLVVVGEGLPSRAAVGRLSKEPFASFGEPVQVFGFPRDPPRPLGTWVACKLSHSVGSRLLQVDADVSAAIRAQAGFSGAPLWNSERKLIVGMLAIADNEARDAYAIPSDVLISAWSEVLEDRSIPPCPYRGLEAFREEDANVFFGRERETAALIQMAKGNPVTVVVGSSGVGKSSLVRAGLLAAVREEGEFDVALCRPGSLPFESVAASFMRQTTLLPNTLDELERLASDLRNDGLEPIASRIELLTGRPILLVVDQFEEAFGDDLPSDMRLLFINQLLRVATSPTRSLRVVITIRADFLPALLDIPGVAEALQDNVLFLSPLDSQALRRVVAQPAERENVRFAAYLIDRIVTDASSGPGILPLLEFTLQSLWDHQERSTISHESYMGMGGVIGAANKHAESVVDRLTRKGIAEDALRSLLTALVRIEGSTERATRRVARRADLPREAWTVAEELARERLVVLGVDYDNNETVELAHEALTVAWKRLNDWLEEDRSFLTWRSRMENTVAEEDVLSERKLAEARMWLQQRPDDVTADIVALVERSAAEIARSSESLNTERARALAAAADSALKAPRTPIHISQILAIESLRAAKTYEGDRALRNVMGRLEDFRREREFDDYAMRVRSGGEIARLSHDAPVVAVDLSPRGRLIISVGDDGDVQILQLNSSRPVVRESTLSDLRTHAHAVPGFAFNQKDETYALIDTDGAVVVRHMSRDQPEQEIKLPHAAKALAFDTDGSSLCIATTTRGYVYSIPAFEQIASMSVGSPVVGVHFSRSGDRVATVSRFGVAVFNAGSGEQEWAVDVSETARVVAAEFDADCDVAAVVQSIGAVNLVSHGRSPANDWLITEGWHALSVAISHDGEHVAVGAREGFVGLYSTDDTSSVRSLLDLKWPIRALDFDDTNESLAVGSDHGGIWVLDVRSGRVINVIDYGQSVTCLRFGWDQLLISGHRDGSVFVSTLDTDAIVEWALRLVERDMTPAEWRQYFDDEPQRLYAD